LLFKIKLTLFLLLYLSPIALPQEADIPLNDENVALYQIKLSRLKRLVEKDTGQNNLEYTSDLIQLLKDAQNFFNMGEYELAIDFLESAFSLLQMANSENRNMPNAKTLSNFQWTFQAISGSELWQQRFGISLGQSDSVIYESQGNPFIGLRAILDHQKGSQQQTQLELEAKTSTDYNSTNLVLNHKNQHGLFRFFVDNYFDASIYKRDKDLSYLENRLDLGFICGSNNLGIILRDELQWRSYSNESDYFFSYTQNRIEPKIFINFSQIGRFELLYSQRSRDHSDADERNYTETWSGLDFWSRGRFNVKSQLYNRSRNYNLAFSDSLFNNNFKEIYFESDVRYVINRRVSFRLDGHLERKKYQEFFEITPHYRDYTIEPSVELNPGLRFHVRLGYQYRKREHYFDDNSQANPDYENFYNYGPILGLDIFAFNGFMASISNSFEMRRFPNSFSQDNSSLSLYSDRNINSIFFFISWDLSPQWYLNVMAHFDYDKYQNYDDADSQTNLFNFELSYKF
jgi:hypothetical protein